MRKQYLRLSTLLLVLAAPTAMATGAVEGALSNYRAEGAGPFSAEAGARLWREPVTNPESGDKRDCTLCHNSDLTTPGKHQRTGKVIEPMAPSVNPARLSDRKKLEKWFRRNCRWTWDRECTPQEKGDILIYLRNQ